MKPIKVKEIRLKNLQNDDDPCWDMASTTYPLRKDVVEKFTGALDMLPDMLPDLLYTELNSSLDS